MIKKIKLILEKYKENDAQTWEIGTNFYNSCILIGEKIKLLPSNFNLPSYVNIICNDNQYKLFCGEVNITPITLKKDSCALSTLRQYLQELSALGLINYCPNDVIENGSKFDINPKIYELSDCNNLTYMIFSSLIKSIDSPLYFCKNLGYSLFLSLLITHDENILSNDEIKNYIIKRKTNSKNKSWKTDIGKEFYLQESYSLDFLKHVKGENTDNFGSGKNTYIEAVNKLLNDFNFEIIIENMYKYLYDKDLPFIYIIENEIEKKYLLFKNMSNELKNSRNKLRKNMIENRFNNKYININKNINILFWFFVIFTLGLCLFFNKQNTDKKFSDLEHSLPNSQPIEFLDACHIYDYWRIIKELKEKCLKNDGDKNGIKKIINKASDYNNGLFLNKNAHNLFDKNYVWFDINGKLHYMTEAYKQVKEAFGDDLKIIKIKQNILNKEMIKYITERNN